MLLGEYTATREIQKFMPDLVPTPIAMGKFLDVESPSFFFFSKYNTIDFGVANLMDKFVEQLAKLHRTATSANGQFGFSTTTCDGTLAQDGR